VDGDSKAIGGNGGTGGSCCSPPGASGGSGGRGGKASAFSWPKWSKYTAIGGNGGNGGPGKGPGGGGAGGPAAGAGKTGTATKGADGLPGALCSIWGEWYPYFSSIPDGPIPPGSKTISVYKSKDASPTNKVGEITVRFDGPVMKNGDRLQMQAGGSITFDATSFTGGDPNPKGWPTWFPKKAVWTFRNESQWQCAVLEGFYNQQLISDVLNQNPGGAGSVESIEIDTGTDLAVKYDSIVTRATFDLSFDHWGIRIVWFDP